MAQTTVVRLNAIRFGSAKFEVGADIGSLINLGALRAVAFKELWDELQVGSDNAGVLIDRVKNQRCEITANWLEWDTEAANTLRGGLDVYSTQAGTPVNITDEQVVLPGTTLKALAFKNASGVEVTSIVVTHLSGIPTYVRGTDYEVGVDQNGYTRICRSAAGGAITDGQTVLVDYTYTPAQNKQLKSGGKYSISPRVVRLSNLNAAGKKFEVTIWRAFNKGPLEIPWPGDEGDDALLVPISLGGVLDTAKTAGEQLYQIIDEQSIT